MATKPIVTTVDINNAEQYLNELKKRKINPSDVVFPFPSAYIKDPVLRSSKTNIHQRYNSKSAVVSGLVQAADILSDLHVGTWNLPVDHIEAATEEATIDAELTKLWEMVGAGKTLVFPALDHFKTSTQHQNPVVDAYYAQQIQVLIDFAASTHEDPEELTNEDGKRVKLDFANAYKAGQSLRDAANADRKAQSVLADAPAPAARNSGNFDQLYKKQVEGRFWRKVAAWTFSVLSLGLLAIPLYRWYQSRVNAENIQPVKIKPVDFEVMQAYTAQMLNSTETAKQAMADSPILHRAGKPQKQMPADTADATQTQTYYMDKHAKSRFELMQGLFKGKQTQLSDADLGKMQDLTKDSVALAPALGISA